MRLAIVAATGGIGRHLLQQAIEAGHDVTALVRSPEKITDPVRTVGADLAHPDVPALAEAIKGADAILSALGARTKAESGVAWRGTAALVEAAWETRTRRLIVVSAAPMGTFASPGRPHPPRHDPGDGFFMRHLGAPFAKTMFRTHYEDLARMEDVVRDSGLDWTVSRPPKLTDGPLTRRYRTAIDRNVRGGFSVSRADVADQMLACVTRAETIGHTVGIAQ
ncbi:NAD(P)H-binding protein [Actinoplanes sp. KI2]|uniref:NAD(P)-dependent oxidoreductase n=1 Tax=Actinoplanes sp. KI2 TaxID=2983315 RepID=UPI0021D60570|nr:NAD(P)H-binding protein [Actinoplanes sp. KI2]MCU7730465.1 NAD(P)H-binding protein [Actinoplanes sp. KI2]